MNMIFCFVGYCGFISNKSFGPVIFFQLTVVLFPNNNFKNNICNSSSHFLPQFSLLLKFLHYPFPVVLEIFLSHHFLKFIESKILSLSLSLTPSPYQILLYVILLD